MKDHPNAARVLLGICIFGAVLTLLFLFALAAPEIPENLKGLP